MNRLNRQQLSKLVVFLNGLSTDRLTIQELMANVSEHLGQEVSKCHVTSVLKGLGKEYKRVRAKTGEIPKDRIRFLARTLHNLLVKLGEPVDPRLIELAEHVKREKA